MAYSPYKMKGHTLPGIKQSPVKAKLIGDQHRLPEELKAKIKASPARMIENRGMDSAARGTKGIGSDGQPLKKKMKPCPGCKTMCPGCKNR